LKIKKKTIFSLIMLTYKSIDKETPKHKDLVLCWDGTLVLPAIYYNNPGYKGFYHYTSFYHEYNPTVYSKVKVKPKHQIHNVKAWYLITEPSKIDLNVLEKKLDTALELETPESLITWLLAKK
jgi:hypothetical protein